MHLVEAIEMLLASERPVLLVAIDGRCATGKTTLTARLAGRFECTVFHMDDFFLRPEQRTAERLAAAGGNVDYERVAAEVLAPLRAGQTAEYRPWGCRTGAFGAPVRPARTRLNIIEGAYALHPTLRDLYDLRVVLTAPFDVRLARLRRREDEAHFRDYLSKWIPLEDLYFAKTGVEEAADIVVESPP